MLIMSYTLRLTSELYLMSSLTRFMSWIMTAMWRGEHPLTFWALTWAYWSGLGGNTFEEVDGVDGVAVGNSMEQKVVARILRQLNFVHDIFLLSNRWSKIQLITWFIYNHQTYIYYYSRLLYDNIFESFISMLFSYIITHSLTIYYQTPIKPMNGISVADFIVLK